MKRAKVRWIKVFSKRLSAVTETFVRDLGELIVKVRSDDRAAALFIEYSYGSLNIFAYAADATDPLLGPLGKVIRLPSTLQNQDLFPADLKPTQNSSITKRKFLLRLGFLIAGMHPSKTGTTYQRFCRFMILTSKQT